MSAPLRPQLGLPSPRPEGSQDPYLEDQWSDDDPADEHGDAPRRRTRTHNIPSRSGRSSFVPSGQGARGETVPYGRPPPQRADTDPFSSTPGLRTRPYSGYYGMPSSQTPFAAGEPYSSPPGGYPQGPGYYPAEYGTAYTTAPPPDPSPFSSGSFYPSTPANSTPFGYTSPYEPPPPPPPPPRQPFGPSYHDGRTGIRGPTIRVRKTQVEPQPQARARQADDDREREADERHWRERQRQKARNEREAQKKDKDRERRDMNRIKFERMKLQVEKLRNQLNKERLERSRGAVRGDFEQELRAQDMMQYLQGQRELESQRRQLGRNDSMTQLLQDLAELAEAKREYQASQDRLQFLGGLPTRSRSRSSFGDAGYDMARRREIEGVLRDILSGGLWDEDVTRLPLPARSHHTGRSASEDYYPEDEFPRPMSRQYQDEEEDVSPRPRYSEVPGNVGDPYAGPSSPRHRTGEPGPSIIRDPYPSPESNRYGPSRSGAPPIERRQTAPPTGPTPILKVVPPGSSKRPRGSDFSSDHSLAADRGEYSAYDPREVVAEQYQRYRSELPRRTEPYREELRPAGDRVQDEPRRPEHPREDAPRRTETDRPGIQRAQSHRSSGTRRSSTSVPRLARSPERPGLRRNRSRVAFQDQDPTGGRPILDDEDDTSASESAAVSRRAGSYRIVGARVSGRRYNPRDATPPYAPEAPRSETPAATERTERTERPSRPPRRAQVEDGGWSDDEEVQGGRFMSHSRESTLGR